MSACGQSAARADSASDADQTRTNDNDRARTTLPPEPAQPRADLRRIYAGLCMLCTMPSRVLRGRNGASVAIMRLRTPVMTTRRFFWKPR